MTGHQFMPASLYLCVFVVPDLSGVLPGGGGR